MSALLWNRINRRGITEVNTVKSGLLVTLNMLLSARHISSRAILAAIIEDLSAALDMATIGATVRRT